MCPLKPPRLSVTAYHVVLLYLEIGIENAAIYMLQGIPAWFPTDAILFTKSSLDVSPLEMPLQAKTLSRSPLLSCGNTSHSPRP